MKKKICLLLILVLICTVAFGCTSQHEEECSNAVDDFLAKYQQCDPDAGAYVESYVDNGQLQYSGVQALIAERLTYEIEGAEENDDGCVVSVRISSPDFEAVFSEVIAEFSASDTEEVVLQDVEKKITSPDVPMRDFTLDIMVSGTDGAYQIEMTAELSNALAGGYHEYVDSLVEEMLNG